MYEGDEIPKHFHTITYCFFILLLTLTWVDLLAVCFEVKGEVKLHRLSKIRYNYARNLKFGM